MTGALLAGRYELGSLLGAGGMARVHAAHDLVLDRPVAVKVLADELVDATARERFVREARTSARFVHPDAVSVYDAGESDGALYLVMELVEGRSLAARLAADGPLPLDEALRIGRSVLDALGAAHAAGIVHRDVKPGNILLPDGGGSKLADFGIAKRLDELEPDLTGTGQLVGTPKYLAPEQVVGEPVTAATDLYATGVVIYEMLAGSAPFDGGTPLAAALAHRDEPAPDVRAMRPEVPEAVADALIRAMAKRPEDRFPSAAAMRNALGAASVSEAPAGAPAAPTEQMPTSPRPTSPRPILLVPGLVAAAVILLLVLGALATRDRGAVDGVATTGAPAASDAPATVAATTVAAPTTNAPTTVAATTPAPPPTVPAPATPGDLAALIAFLEPDPDAAGPAGRELLTQLGRVAEREGRKQSDLAAEVLGRVDGWVDDGELDPAVAELTRPILEPLAAGPGNRDDGGDGDG